jgi:hypothetical protein
MYRSRRMRPTLFLVLATLAACGSSSEATLDGSTPDGSVADAGAVDAITPDGPAADSAAPGPDAAPGCGNGAVTPGDVCLGGQAWTTFSTGEAAYAVAVADVTGDGLADILTANQSPAVLGQDVSLLVGSGDGAFVTPSYLATGSSNAAAIAVADIDHALGPDLIVGDAMGVVLFHGLGNGGFDAPTRIHSTGYPFDLSAVDIDHDNDDDVIIADGHSEDVIVLKNTAGSFEMTAQRDTATIPNRLAIADVTGDSVLDVLSADWQPTYTGGVSLYTGAPGAALAAGILLPSGGQGPISVVATDVDDDALADVIVSYRESGGVRVFKSMGGGQFVPLTTATTEAKGGQLALGDVDHDGRLDVLVLDRSAAKATILLNHGTGLVTTVELPLNARATRAVLADVNGDGALDVVALEPEAKVVAVLLQDP